MNADHDPQVIARVRAALDEVAATHAVAVADPTHPGWSGRRWLAIAASVVLVAGAITAIAVNLSNRQSVSPAGPTGSTAPTTGSSDTGPTTPTMPYFLAAADLAPGPVEAFSCCVAGEMFIAWALDGDPAKGLITARTFTQQDDGPPATTPNGTMVDVNTVPLAVDSFGLTDAERDVLVAQIVPGSGLPWVLPVEGWTFMGVTAGGTDPWTARQVFGDQVELTTNLRADVLVDFVGATDARNVEVAGLPGWAFTAADGQTEVLWLQNAQGSWHRLRIPAALADRVDGLIAAIVPTGDNGATASTVPTPDQWVGEVSLEMAVSSYALAPYDPSTLDPAVGQPIPTIRLTDGEFTVDTPTLFVFAAHWCPHCAAELDGLRAAIEDGSLDGVHVVVVSTAVDLAGANYPPTAWLSEHGWTGDVLHDTSTGDGSPGVMAGYFGLPGYPYLVMVDGDGLVAGRAVGELPIADLVALTDIAGPSDPAQSAVVGQLEVPAIDHDWFVVDGSGGLDQAARLGPVLVGAVSPTTLRSQPASDPVSVVVFGHRATYGSPFLRLAELKPGDRIVWTDQSGTATFEVVATTTCTEADIQDCPPASAQDQLVLLTQHPDVSTQGWLMVTAHRVG